MKTGISELTACSNAACNKYVSVTTLSFIWILPSAGMRECELCGYESNSMPV